MALLAGGACIGTGRIERTVGRVIADASAAPFDLSTVGAPAELFSWTFERPGALDEWQLVNADRVARIEDGGLVIESSGNDPQIVRATDLNADSIETLEFLISGPVEGNLRVYWARTGEEFSEERAVTAPRYGSADADASADLHTVRLPINQHFNWHGQVRFLRIDPTDHPGERVRIVGIRGYGLVAQPDRIRAAAGKAWGVTLADDHRPALLAGFDEPIERSVMVPSGGMLRFAYGVKCVHSGAAPRTPAHLQILATTPGEAARPVFDRVIDAGTGVNAAPYGGWRDGEAQLPAGDRVLLTFRVDPASQVDVACLAAWANPVVVARSSAPPPPNVIVISIDTLRSDRISLYGSRPGLTPEVDAWARRRGVAFPNTIVAAPWTLPSHVSMLTGLDALTHGVNHDQSAPAQLRFLAERLRAADYSTVAFTGGGYLDPRFGVAQGFDRFIGWSGNLAGEDELVSNMDRFLDWLRSSTTRPFFAFFHTYEVHEPYLPRQPYFEDTYSGSVADRAGDVGRALREPPGDALEPPFDWRPAWQSEPDAPTTPEFLDLLNALYDSGVSYTDAAIGRLLRELENLGLEDDTIVILTSDHGETLGEEGNVGHGYLSNDNLVVPLIIAAPGVGGGSVNPERVRSIDIVPTILELTGVEADGMDGASLVPLLDGRPFVSEDAWSYSSSWGVSLRLTDATEYIFDPTPWYPRHGRERAYELLPGEPETRAPAAAGTPDTTLRRRVVDRLQAMPGLDVRFTNRGDQPFSGALHQADRPLNPLKIKTPQLPLPCDCLRWGADGSVQFTVPAGTSYSIRLQGIHPDDLVFEGTLDGRGFDAHISPYEIQSVHSLSLTGPGAQFVDGGLSGDIGISVDRTSLQGVDSASTPTDPELLRRLRALGYLR
ncbi:MAG: sulfatase [Acidobacteriota bacterium]